MNSPTLRIAKSIMDAVARTDWKRNETSLLGIQIRTGRTTRRDQRRRHG